MKYNETSVRCQDIAKTSDITEAQSETLASESFA